MYNPEHQYRCTIIRGKAKKELDNLLPLYANVIEELTPCDKETFAIGFNSRLLRFMPGAEKKTLDNHRTEIAGKLFGLFSETLEGEVLETERCRKFLSDHDQPAFFKEMCFKIQFPNGMDSVATIKERIDKRISILTECYVVALLTAAFKIGLRLTVDDVAYYVLNNLDVLQGQVSPNEVIKAIIEARKQGKNPSVHTQGKASSYDMQHIREQLVYLELANLIYVKDNLLYLNTKEKETIDAFCNAIGKPLPFDAYSYNLSDVEDTKRLRSDWTDYYGRLSKKSEEFGTALDALQKPQDGNAEILPPPPSTSDTAEIGHEGEQLVLAYEKERVKEYDRHLLNRINYFGNITGLGYDILSVMANQSSDGAMAKYIEVKSTKRVTEPDFDDPLFTDSFNITRNEWIAAKQNGRFFSFYRVYLLPDKIIFLVINDPYKKCEDNKIDLVPLTYRLDFGSKEIDQNITRSRL